MTTPTAHNLIIHGKVQGVYYRAWTQKTAQHLGITGWVRNRKNGTVEIHAIAPNDQIFQTFLNKCQDGPPAASVNKIDSSPTRHTLFDGFEIEKTI